MHAVIIRVSITDGEAATENLRNEIVPQVKQAPGFVAGYWTRVDPDQGRGTIVFESEDAASQAAEMVRGEANVGVNLESVEVGEVIESA